jgi:uncharacterized protein (DUF169 family)
MNSFNEFGKSIEEQLRLNTSVIAVKLLRSEDEVPEGSIRPTKSFSHCLSTCQAFTLSRRFGEMVTQLFEDMWCPEPVIGFGLAEPPDYFFEGKTRFPDGVASLEAGANWAKEFPRLPVGEYKGVVSAPMREASFEPDVAVVYCDSAQLLRLLLAIAYKDGKDIHTVLGGHSACVYAVVPSILSNECTVSVPCRGDRGYAGTQDYEMIFTIPKDKVGRVAEGLKIGGTGTTPTRFSMNPEYRLSEGYAEIARQMGQKAADGSKVSGSSAKERRLSLQYR